jgi:hypothetical protein
MIPAGIMTMMMVSCRLFAPGLLQWQRLLQQTYAYLTLLLWGWMVIIPLCGYLWIHLLGLLLCWSIVGGIRFAPPTPAKLVSDVRSEIYTLLRWFKALALVVTQVLELLCCIGQEISFLASVIFSDEHHQASLSCGQIVQRRRSCNGGPGVLFNVIFVSIRGLLVFVGCKLPDN